MSAKQKHLLNQSKKADCENINKLILGKKNFQILCGIFLQR